MAQLLDYLSEKYQQESLDEINRRLLELSSLFEISQLINESLELSRVLNNILFIPMGRMMLSRGAIILRIDDEYRVVMAKGIPEALQSARLNIDEIPQSFFYTNDKSLPNSEGGIADFARQSKLEIAVPFISGRKTLGLMLFGAKLTRQPFSGEETDFLKSLANISASTIENALKLEEIQKVNRQLDEKVHELKTLFDIGRGLSSTLEYNKILKLLVYALMGQMLISKYCILVCDDDGPAIHENKGFDFKGLESLMKKLMKLKLRSEAFLPENCGNKRLLKSLEKMDVHALIPMTHQDKCLGYILLGPKISGQGYMKSDLEFLTTLVSQAVISLENARLFEETLEKQRLEEELNLARNIQKKLLPKSIPDVEGYEIHGFNLSSKQVGGDYWDVITIDEHRVALAIGDVSGKGVPASLLMANLQAALRVMTRPDMNLAEVVATLNKLIHANTDLDKFITFFIGVLDTRDHTFEYVNAGHNNPHFFQARKKIQFLDIGGLLLGIMPMYQYTTGKINLKKGDLVLTYTDGVNEALDPSGEEFGDERLNDLTNSLRRASPEKLVETVWRTIDDFSCGMPQADDVTMLAVKRLK